MGNKIEETPAKKPMTSAFSSGANDHRKLSVDAGERENRSIGNSRTTGSLRHKRSPTPNKMKFFDANVGGSGMKKADPTAPIK